MPIDRNESATLMTKLVYPRIKGLLSVEPVELFADAEKIADFLGTQCKIDALIQFNGHISTACSRVHIVKNGSQPYHTFTLKYGNGPHVTKSQYMFLLNSISKSGALYPYYTVESYVNENKDQLLSSAIIETKQLVEHAAKYLEDHGGTWRSKDMDMVWAYTDYDFCSVRWKVLKAQGAKMNVWPLAAAE